MMWRDGRYVSWRETKNNCPTRPAFGEKGKDPVPPNATVVFEVEVYSVSRGPRSMEAFKMMDLDEDRSLTKEEVKQYLQLETATGHISAKEYNIYGH
ncbi:hypothetical protein KUCAC02_010729 [Chaenocephalus aceratus]|uniref:Uncharacterized protein n=1 Tax=Chaenocephalus aceratus TaxID=36190 RepID=A0ACB9W1G9_CHAAC|nr:hypothetical protein KUCAC02_010729 [Chaenocephalus aceratus]